MPRSTYGPRSFRNAMTAQAQGHVLSRTRAIATFGRNINGTGAEHVAPSALVGRTNNLHSGC
jgi:hypothetical protein